MGTLAPTPTLGLVLPDPGTAQPFSTAVQNGWFQGIDTAVGADRARLTTIEDLTKPSAPGANIGVIPAGTTAERDLFWGSPGDAAARVALAQKMARWFNTEKGYEQQYFAQFDDAGVGTAPAKTVHGWGAAAHLGEVPVRAASVAVGSGTGVQRGGSVEFAGASTLSLNGIFTADFTKYRCHLEMDSGSSDAGLTFQMRAAGVNLTTSTYAINQIENTSGGALGGGSPGNSTSGLLGRVSGTGDSAQEFWIVSPFLTKRTHVRGHSMDATLFQRLFATVVQNAVSYDGIHIIFGMNATGRLRIFGVNDY